MKLKKTGKRMVGLCCLMAILLMPCQVVWAAESLNIKGESCVLMDPSTGEILYEQNKDQKWFPASTTKIMTLVLALEAVKNGKVSLEDKVVTSDYAASMGGAQVYLYPGEERTLNEMLIAIAVGSANDASTAVAEFLGGTEENFAQLMNDKAQQIGMSNSHFVNPHGLHDDNHYTTAYDLALLGNYALGVPHLLEYTSIYEYDFRPEPKPLKLWSTNKLLKWYDGVDGLKTGSTSNAKRNLVATAQRDGLRLLTVVMGVGESNGHFKETMKLFNYGFNQYEFKTLYHAGDIIGQIAVSKGQQDNVDLIAQEPIGVVQLKSAGDDLQTKIMVDNYITAPISQNQQCGEIIVLRDGAVIKKTPLLAEKGVEKCQVWDLWLKCWQQVVMAG